MESVLVNFRMPQARYQQIREVASRCSVSISEYIRNCVGSKRAWNLCICRSEYVAVRRGAFTRRSA